MTQSTKYETIRAHWGSRMVFEIDPFVGAGPIKLGMTPVQARNCLGGDFTSFKRTPAADYPCDHFRDFGVFINYREPYVVAAIEFGSPAEPIFEGKNLLKISYKELAAIISINDKNCEFDVDTIISNSLGIGVYCPDANENPESPVESIIVFEKGYYDT